MPVDKVRHIINQLWYANIAFVDNDDERFWFLYPPYSGFNRQKIKECISRFDGPSGCQVNVISANVISTYNFIVHVPFVYYFLVPDFCTLYHLELMEKNGEVRKLPSGTYTLH